MLSYHQITLLLFVALCSASLAHFAQMSFEKGMIFRWYFAWLTYWFDFKPRKRRWRIELNGVMLKNKVTSDPLWYSYLYKPLGGCIYCHSVWLGFAMFPLTSVSILYLIPYTALVYMFVELEFTFISHDN